jgi:uncharacterized Ntn-hydrolase superfamily protein
VKAETDRLAVKAVADRLAAKAGTTVPHVRAGVFAVAAVVRFVVSVPTKRFGSITNGRTSSRTLSASVAASCPAARRASVPNINAG